MDQTSFSLVVHDYAVGTVAISELLEEEDAILFVAVVEGDLEMI